MSQTDNNRTGISDRSCLSQTNHKPLCNNGVQRRFSGDRYEDVPCILCRPLDWAEWAKNWKVPIVPKPEPPQTALFSKERDAYAD